MRLAIGQPHAVRLLYYTLEIMKLAENGGLPVYRFTLAGGAGQ